MNQDKIKNLVENFKIKLLELKERWREKSTGVDLRTAKAPKLFKVKIWDPTTLDLKTKYYVFKREIVLGSDRSADLVLPALRGLESRLNFLTGDLLELVEDRILPCPENEIFHVGPYALQWSSPRVLEKSMKLGILLVVAGALLLGYMGFQSGVFISCDAVSEKLAKGHWERTPEGADAKTKEFFENLSLYRRSFKQAMAENLLVKARGELTAIEEDIMSHLENPRIAQKCNALAKAKEMEVEFTEALLAEKYKDKRLESAAADIMKLRARFQNNIDVKKLVSQLLAETKSLYYEGYGLTDLEPARGKEIMNRAAQVCETLGLSENCFKNRRSAGIPTGLNSRRN